MSNTSKKDSYVPIEDFAHSKKGYDDAVELMHELASKIVKMEETDRFGISVREIRMGPHKKMKRWTVCVHDRYPDLPKDEFKALLYLKDSRSIGD